MILDSIKSLTLFERRLWIFSLVIVSLSYLFLPEKDYINLIVSLIGVTSLIFVAKGNVIGHIFGILFSVIYAFIATYYHYYGELITYACLNIPIEISIIYTWLKHPYQDTNEVEIKTVQKKEWILLSIGTILITIIFYFILKYFNTTNLVFSTLSISTSFFASTLSFLRSPYYALGYCANDIMLIILWILASLENMAYFPMVICFIMFFVNDVYGYYNWKKIYRRQNDE